MSDEVALVDEEKVDLESGELPSRYGKIVNHAENAELVENFRAWASKQVMRFDGQAARERFVRTGGTMDIADRMWRVALNRDESNSQTKDTLSNVTSPMFHTQIRSITAGESTIFFGDGRMPAEFEPEINTSEYTQRDGRDIAQQQNILEEYTFDEDRRVDKIKELLHFVNKYAIQVVGMDWCREVRETTENVPDIAQGKLPNGQWRAFKRVTKERVVKDWPTFWRDPVENCWFDANIAELADQRCFAVRRRVGIEKVYAGQANGYYRNAEKVTDAHLYGGEAQNDSPLEQRSTNAGDSERIEPTGEVELWDVWARVPIKTKATRRASKAAKWAPGEAQPELWWGVFAGNLHQGGAVCLKLCRNPHWHGQIPYKLIRSHRDDKGAFSTGFAEMLQSLYWQAVTNLNQSIDNVTERNWAPMIANGPVFTRDLTFRKNKLIEVERTTELKRLEIPDTTQITMAMHDIVEKQAARLTGADKPVVAEALGGRTSATEAKNIYDQAMMPLDEKAAFMADQIFPWMLSMDAALWRQYGDPEQVIAFSHNNLIQQANPGELYGPVRTKITALARFRTNTMRRQELNSFLQNVAPIFVNAMGEEGLRVLGREAFRVFGIDKGEEIFPLDADYDARARALSTVESILVAGQWVEPQPTENHKAHLAVLVPALRQFELLGDTPEQNLALMRQHIAMREAMVEQKLAQLAGLAQQIGPGETAPPGLGLPGEVAANPMEAQAGGLANV